MIYIYTVYIYMIYTGIIYMISIYIYIYGLYIVYISYIYIPGLYIVCASGAEFVTELGRRVAIKFRSILCLTSLHLLFQRIVSNRFSGAMPQLYWPLMKYGLRLTLTFRSS